MERFYDTNDDTSMEDRNNRQLPLRFQHIDRYSNIGIKISNERNVQKEYLVRVNVLHQNDFVERKIDETEIKKYKDIGDLVNGVLNPPQEILSKYSEEQRQIACRMNDDPCLRIFGLKIGEKSFETVKSEYNFYPEKWEDKFVNIILDWRILDGWN